MVALRLFHRHLHHPDCLDLSQVHRLVERAVCLVVEAPLLLVQEPLARPILHHRLRVQLLQSPFSRWRIQCLHQISLAVLLVQHPRWHSRRLRPPAHLILLQIHHLIRSDPLAACS